MNKIKNELTSFELKWLGIILMVFDHIHQMFSTNTPVWFNMLGRPVAPIFLFLSAEGYHYTRDKKRYMLNLLFGYYLCTIIFTAVSIFLPNDHVSLFNNMFGTLFLGLLSMWVYDGFFGSNRYIGKAFLGLIYLVLTPILLISILPIDNIPFIIKQIFILLTPSVMTVEGGIYFVILALFFHIFRNKRIFQYMIILILGCVSFLFNPSSIEWMLVFSVIPISLYKGKQGRKDKCFFYIFYPAHIVILYIVSTVLLQS